MALFFAARRAGPAVVAMLFAVFACGTVGGQSPAARPAMPGAARVTPRGAQAPAKVTPHSGKYGRKARAAKAAADAVPVVEAPVAPVAPKWPANEKAGRATVVWDGRALKIAAENSSLQQILHDVSTATGLKVEGLGSSTNEQRIYGSYGPAEARDVLGQLLEGSGYNVLMIGDQGQGTPRVLVLTSRSGGKSAKPAQAPTDDNQDGAMVEDDSPDEPELVEPPETPLQSPNLQRPFGGGPPPGAGGRTPQEVLQELQQRQLIQQQQLQQQPQEIQPQDSPPQ